MWQSQVDKFVKEFTNSNKVFTAYDVTKAVQAEQLNSGIKQPTRHLEMRNYIHDKVCAVSGYMRKLEKLPNGGEAYHYKPVNPVQQVTTKPLGSVAPYKAFVPVSFSQSVNSVNNPPTTQLCNRDKRGSISVPSRFVTQLAPTAERVSVYKDSQGKLFIQPDNFPHKQQTDYITSYTIDSHKNVRVTKKTLSNLSHNGPYQVSLDNGEITVE